MLPDFAGAPGGVTLGVGMALEQELAFFSRNRDEYVRTYPGQFLLIKGEQLVGGFTTEAEAYAAGLSKFGNQPFLIKQAVTEEPKATFLALQYGLLRAHP
jgi:hypothetical protein